MPDDIINDPINDISDEFEIVISGESEEIDPFSVSAEQVGPYETHLYTEGNEFWLEDVISVEMATLAGHGALVEGNSYIGWYHVRNAKTQYQALVPTKTAEEEYTGPLLFGQKDWLLKKGLHSQANHPDLNNVPSIKGCTNPEAWNYNPLATQDDGTCWIIPGYFLGQIPPEKMNGLHTTGGELTNSETMMQYKGYYHVNGSGDLPLKSDGTPVEAGSIYTGKEWTGDNILLWPVHVEGRFLAERDGIDVTEGETTTEFKNWHDVISNHTAQMGSLELEFNEAAGYSDINNLVIEIDTTTAGQFKDFVAFDNKVTFTDSIQVMNNTDYQFNFLLDDTDRSPGIYGMKPKITSNLNVVDFSEEVPPVEGETGDYTGMPDSIELGNDNSIGMA